MKTDPLFYELFQTAPQIYFELLQIPQPCPYRFESITVKATEKRIDGVLEPTKPDQPIHFVEVQAAPDEEIYWRVTREVATYFEQRPALKGREWQAVVIWLGKPEPKGQAKPWWTEFGTVLLYDGQNKQRLYSVDIIDLLGKLPENSLALNVLRPLIVDNERQVRQNISTWVEQIHATPGMSPDVEQRLVMVMTQLIEEKFKTLSYEELTMMLQLTPLRETASVQKVLQEELQSFSIDKLIKMIKRKFKFAESTIAKIDTRLRQLTLKDLEILFESIFDLSTLRELNAWIDSRLPPPQNDPSQLANLQN